MKHIFFPYYLNKKCFILKLAHIVSDLDVYSAAHYVFPEDRPAEDQHEVRTVEEESLFRVAFPELVESYLRDKALAEENKTKSKTILYKLLTLNELM